MEQVVVASTDFDPEQSEEVQVVATEPAVHMNDTWVLTLNQPLKYMHFGEPMPAGVRGVEFPQVRPGIRCLTGHPSDVKVVMYRKLSSQHNIVNVGKHQDVLI